MCEAKSRGMIIPRRVLVQNERNGGVQGQTREREAGPSRKKKAAHKDTKKKSRTESEPKVSFEFGAVDGIR